MRKKVSRCTLTILLPATMAATNNYHANPNEREIVNTVYGKAHVYQAHERTQTIRTMHQEFKDVN